MKAIPIVNTNRRLLCDDEDYELLKDIKWYLYYNKKSRKHLVRCWTPIQCTPIALLYTSFGDYFGFKFRDGNVCNYQRYNIQWFHANGGEKVTSQLLAPHCHLGPAILRPKTTEGRSLACFICCQESYEYYYVCLNEVSHKTYWKGWLRHES